MKPLHKSSFVVMFKLCTSLQNIVLRQNHTKQNFSFLPHWLYHFSSLY